MPFGDGMGRQWSYLRSFGRQPFLVEPTATGNNDKRAGPNKPRSPKVESPRVCELRSGQRSLEEHFRMEPVAAVIDIIAQVAGDLVVKLHACRVQTNRSAYHPAHVVESDLVLR